MRVFFFAPTLALCLAAHATPAEWVGAKVVTADPERSRVTLDHEFIKSVNMMPMVMPFKAEKSVDLRGFKAGDKVRFRVVKKVDHLIIDAMEMAK